MPEEIVAQMGIMSLDESVMRSQCYEGMRTKLSLCGELVAIDAEITGWLRLRACCDRC